MSTPIGEEQGIGVNTDRCQHLHCMWMCLRQSASLRYCRDQVARRIVASITMARTAVRVSGRLGKFDFINEIYEPMTEQHNSKSVWCARAVVPRYLFWSGTSRWVINKWQNDGENCFAYCTGGASDAAAGGTWTCFDESGECAEDPNIQMWEDAAQ